MMALRCRMSQQNGLQRNTSNTLQGLGSIVQNNLFLLMSLLLTAKQYIEAVHGLFMEPKPSERLFLCVDDGMLSMKGKYYYSNLTIPS